MSSLHNTVKVKNVSAKRPIGRGIGMKNGGHTVGRGQKGQRSRSGYTRPRPGFEGGQMPLSRRIPKLRGFKRGQPKLVANQKTLSINAIIKLAMKNGQFNIELAEEKLKQVITVSNLKVINSVGNAAEADVKSVVKVLKTLPEDKVKFSASVAAKVN